MLQLNYKYNSLVAINSTIRNLSTLGDRLKAERERLGWTRETMASYGGVSNASQRLYDGNDRVPSVIYLLQLAKAGADFNYLLHAERAGSVAADLLQISEESADKAFRLTWHMWQSEEGRVNSVDDAAELLISLLRQLHLANEPGVDLKALEIATSNEDING